MGDYYNMKNDDINSYFSVANVDELAEIDQHILFVESMIRKYKSFETSEAAQKSEQPSDPKYIWEDISKQITHIKAKKNDKLLNLSVIGEFSTGKSTFINALLGKELLASSAMQGTTVASTIIEYGSTYRMYVEYSNRMPSQDLPFTTFEQLKSVLQTYTTLPSIAQTLKSVHVFMPLEILKHDFRIIDTPGTNVTEAWHEDVTIRTIKETSDLSIILLSASKQLTSTFRTFVDTYLTDILPQCIFIVTKVDELRTRECKRVLSYIKTTTESEFDLKDAVVLPFSSLQVLEAAQNPNVVKEIPDVSADDFSKEALLAHSLSSIQQIIQHTSKQRTLAITKKLASLIDQSYALLSDNMATMSDDYKNRMEMLNRSKTLDLTEFVNKKKQVRLQSFNRKMSNIMDKTKGSLEDEVEGSVENVVANLEECSNIDQLKDFITGSLFQKCTAEANYMIDQSKDYYAKQRKAFREELNTYKKEFSGAYESLKIVPVNIPQSSLKYPDSIQIETANLTSATDYIAEQLAKENSNFLGGAATGATIGTAIAPGLGTIVGVFFGLIVGAARSPDTNKVRIECKSKLRPQLKAYYENIAQDMMRAMEKYSESLEECMEDEMDAYISRYHEEVDRIIASEEAVRKQINRQSATLDLDKHRLLNHKQQLESVMKQLNQLGRKETEDV